MPKKVADFSDSAMSAPAEKLTEQERAARNAAAGALFKPPAKSESRAAQLAKLVTKSWRAVALTKLKSVHDKNILVARLAAPEWGNPVSPVPTFGEVARERVNAKNSIELEAAKKKYEALIRYAAIHNMDHWVNCIENGNSFWVSVTALFAPDLLPDEDHDRFYFTQEEMTIISNPALRSKKAPLKRFLESQEPRPSPEKPREQKKEDKTDFLKTHASTVKKIVAPTTQKAVTKAEPDLNPPGFAPLPDPLSLIKKHGD